MTDRIKWEKPEINLIDLLEETANGLYDWTEPDPPDPGGGDGSNWGGHGPL